ncbi:hypothetical protein LSAT2_031642 [Lamellibrachia satsuma]|nr:hypothetical protein LSAT2_031642 [Lamellibrachia satsuma]
MSSNNTPMSSQVSHLVRQRETGSAHQVVPVSHQLARWRTWLDLIPRRLTPGEYPGTSCTQTAGLMGGLPWVQPYMTSRLPPPSTVTMGVSGRSLASTMWRHGTEPTPRKLQDGFPQGRYLPGRAATCGPPSGRPNTPAEERARAWRPYTAVETREPSREELEYQFLEALRRYRGSVMSACRDNLHQNDGVLFAGDWQEREIERHQLLRMQRQLRAKSAADKRADVDKEKQRRQTALLGHTSCATPGECTNCENPDRALNQDANVATFIRILEHSRSVTAFDMIPETDQSHDLKHRPHTAAPTVNSHAHGADMLPNNPEGVGYHEHRPKYMAVDKRERSAEAPFRGRISMLPYGQPTPKDIDIKQFDPRNPASAFRIQSSKSIPNRCSRYILVRRPCESAQMIPTPLEEQLILERFPNLQHQWLRDGGSSRRHRLTTLSHQPLLMHHQKLINQMKEIQRRLTEGATK